MPLVNGKIFPRNQCRLLRRLIPFHLFLLLLLLLGSCLPAQQEKKTGACSPGQAFDAKTRSCYNTRTIPAPPTLKLKTIDIVEDTPQIVELIYSDNENDFATACTTKGVSPGISVATCECAGGFCSVLLTPATNFNGISDFLYTLTDDDGTSAPTLVRVQVSAVDDAPVTTTTTPASPISFTEEGTVSVALNYSDVESDKATECEVALNSSVAYLSSPCSCTSTGVCSFSLAGRTDKTTAGESFTFKVKTAGIWSNATTISYIVTNFNDLPLSSTTAPTVPGTINEGDTGISVTLPYYEGDYTRPNDCQIVTGTDTNVDEVSCDCVTAIDATTGLGTCALVIDIDAAASDLNKNTGTTFRFKYQFDDANGGGWGTSSDWVTLTVEPVNDSPILTNVPVGPYVGTEDTVLTVDNNFTIDEGGSTDENSQNIYVQALSDNTSVLPNSSINVKYGGTSVGAGGSLLDLGDSTVTSDLKKVTFEMTPATDLTGGPFNIVVYYKDSYPGASSSFFTFPVTFNPASDDPTLYILNKVCKYDSQIFAPNCSSSGCFSNTTPIGTTTPSKVATIFLNYTTNLCYRSTGNATSSDWTTFATACPITSAKVETGCAITSLSGPLNCMGSGTPVGVVTPAKVGSYYYDYTYNKCYVSTLVGNASSWSEVNLSPTSAVCTYNQSGTGNPVSTVSPTSTASIYKDTSSSTCYYAPSSSSSSWTSFSTACPVSAQTSEPSCKYLNCLGIIPPRGNLPAEDDVVPSSINRYYYDTNTKICYRSVATSTGSANWVIYSPEFSDPKGNEGGPIYLKNILIDEGGDSSENAETMTLAVQNLTKFNSTTYPGNSGLLSLTGIKLFKNGTEIAGVQDAVNQKMTFTIADAGDARLDYLELQFNPNPGPTGYGRAEMKMTLTDSSAKTVDKYYSLLVFPVSTSHNGWEKVTSVGRKVDLQGNFYTRVWVKLSWKDFSIEGNTDSTLLSPIVDPSRTNYASVGISGYNIYRRMNGENFNYNRPLNGSTLISKDTKSFTDTYAITSTIPGAPNPATVYYYTVAPVDNFNSLSVFPKQSFSTMRVVAPPDNMSFVHRWMVNKEICDRLKATTDPFNNFRCNYNGVGETSTASGSYYDIGYDMLVDQFEAGCPYSSNDSLISPNCKENSCIGQADPLDVTGASNVITGPVNNMVYYNRSSGQCFKYNSVSSVWMPYNGLGATLSSAQAKATLAYNLPPLVLITQSTASATCTARSTATLTVKVNGTTKTTSAATLPSRKEQMAFSAWDTGTGYTDSEVDTLETGFSLNASSKCNSSKASGLEAYYTDTDIPNSAVSFSLPGNFASGIRSMATGSYYTDKCASRYGVQDFVGNVKEWVEDRIYCPNKYLCMGVTSTMSGISCNFNLDDEITNAGLVSNTCGDYGCVGIGTPHNRITAGASDLLYYDSTNDKCYVSTTSATNWQQIYSNAAGALNTSCPLSRTTSELKCTDDFLGGGGLNCISTLGTTSTVTDGSTTGIGATKSLNFYLYRSLGTTSSCFRSGKKGEDLDDPDTWEDVSTEYPYPLSKLPPSVLNGNTDMKVNDDYYSYFAFDGLRGPCIDGDANGSCDDSALTGWVIANEPYKAGHFFFPLGLPVHNEFKIFFPESKIISSLLEIGPSAGITSNALHNDFLSINAATIVTEDQVNRCGAMAGGGSYISGNKAGRYAIDFIPCADSATSTDSNGNGIGTDDDRAKDIGFRCLIPINFTSGSGQVYQE